jgi:hypothetical protein
MGLLIIRAWVEPLSTSPLRAYIRLTTDVAEGFDPAVTVTQQQAVVEVVVAWLSDILLGSGAPRDDADRQD